MSETTHPVAQLVKAVDDTHSAFIDAQDALGQKIGTRTLYEDLINYPAARRVWLACHHMMQHGHAAELEILHAQITAMEGLHDSQREHHAAELTRLRERVESAEAAGLYARAYARHEMERDALRARVQELEQATTLQPLDREKVRRVVGEIIPMATNAAIKNVANAICDTFGTPPITDDASVAQLVRSGWGRTTCRTIGELTWEPSDRVLIAPSEP